jgi:ribosome-associated translation inhibitor RaiA
MNVKKSDRIRAFQLIIASIELEIEELEEEIKRYKEKIADINREENENESKDA